VGGKGNNRVGSDVVWVKTEGVGVLVDMVWRFGRGSYTMERSLAGFEEDGREWGDMGVGAGLLTERGAVMPRYPRAPAHAGTG